MMIRLNVKLRWVAAATLATMSAVAMAQALPKATPESVGMSSERLKKITAVMQQEVADKKLPGAVVMVARRGNWSVPKRSAA